LEFKARKLTAAPRRVSMLTKQKAASCERLSYWWPGGRNS
jgi:hypothetical protein